MRRTPALIATAAAIAALSGCASLGSAPAAGGAPSSSPPSAPAAAASQMCTTRACIVDDLQQSLTGLVAQDEAVATKVTCYKRTVKFHRAADTWSATCVVDRSDGSTVTGTGNLLLSAKKVTFQPTGT